MICCENVIKILWIYNFSYIYIYIEREREREIMWVGPKNEHIHIYT